MKRIIVVGLAALALVAVAAPAQAHARPYLSGGEAARVVGSALHREYDNIQVGSLSARCAATRNRSFRRCVYTYYDHAGQCWTGAAGVRELWNRYVYRFLYDSRC